MVTINEPTPVVASVPASTDASCFGASDGDATAGGAGVAGAGNGHPRAIVFLVFNVAAPLKRIGN